MFHFGIKMQTRVAKTIRWYLLHRLSVFQWLFAIDDIIVQILGYSWTNWEYIASWKDGADRKNSCTLNNAGRSSYLVFCSSTTYVTDRFHNESSSEFFYVEQFLTQLCFYVRRNLCIRINIGIVIVVRTIRSVS